jgi:hypothetical protein
MQAVFYQIYQLDKAIENSLRLLQAGNLEPELQAVLWTLVSRRAHLMARIKRWAATEMKKKPPGKDDGSDNLINILIAQKSDEPRADPQAGTACKHGHRRATRVDQHCGRLGFEGAPLP